MVCSFNVLGSNGAGTGFAAFWSMLMVLSLAFGGTMVFRKYQTEGAIGFLLGVTSMMCQMFFLLFCVFLSFANDTNAQYGRDSGADKTYAAFAFILSICYGFVATSLAVFRGDLVPQSGEGSSNIKGIGFNEGPPSTVEV
jgi:hypothetical protein